LWFKTIVVVGASNETKDKKKKKNQAKFQIRILSFSAKQQTKMHIGEKKNKKPEDY
jgi:hypothetical protein